jgi:hypothetical protein
MIHLRQVSGPMKNFCFTASSAALLSSFAAKDFQMAQHLPPFLSKISNKEEQLHVES